LPVDGRVGLKVEVRLTASAKATAVKKADTTYESAAARCHRLSDVGADLFHGGHGHPPGFHPADRGGGIERLRTGGPSARTSVVPIGAFGALRAMLLTASMAASRIGTWSACSARPSASSA
jgi:hypothetical protein